MDFFFSSSRGLPWFLEEFLSTDELDLEKQNYSVPLLLIGFEPLGINLGVHYANYSAISPDNYRIDSIMSRLNFCD